MPGAPDHGGVAGWGAGRISLRCRHQPVSESWILSGCLSETNVGKKAKEMLASFAKNRQALIELEEKELRRMEEDFMKQGSVLSANAKREREELFRRRMAEYQQKVTDLNREVQDKQKDVLESFRDKIEAMCGQGGQTSGSAGGFRSWAWRADDVLRRGGGCVLTIDRRIQQNIPMMRDCYDKTKLDRRGRPAGVCWHGSRNPLTRRIV